MDVKIKIIENLSTDRWSEYRDLYTEAVKNEPLAFSETLEEVEKNTEKDWTNELQEAIDGKSILVFVETGGKIIGMGRGSFHQLKKLSHNAFLSSLYVDKEFRGQGMGIKIVEKIIELISKNKSIKNIFSEIIETQVASIELHKKLGFEIVGQFTDLFEVDGRYYSELYLQKRIS